MPETTLAHLARRLETNLEPNAVLDTVVGVVADAIQARQVAVYVKRVDSEDLVLGAEHHAANHGTEGQAFGSREPEPSADSGDARSSSPHHSFPLLDQAEVVGHLVVVPSEGRPLSIGELDLLETIAERAGSAGQAVRHAHDLLRARERLVLAREEERRRLRRNLHDTIGPTLAALSLNAGALRNLIEQDPAAAEERIRELQEQIHQVITDIRRVVYDLRPPALDELGMVPAIRERAKRFSTSGLQVSVDAPDLMPALPAAVEVAVYRIVVEALTNVERHAHARHCRISLSVNDQVSIEVVDDGVGLRPNHRAGVGIASMRERVAELGGSCTIESPPEGGTRVLAFLTANSRAPGWETTSSETALLVDDSG